MSKLAAASHTFRLAVLLVLVSILLPGGPRRAQATDLVNFASNLAISFPLQQDGLEVAPAHFPFFPLANVDPEKLAVAILKVTRDGQPGVRDQPGIDPTRFTASIDKLDGLYAVKIAVAAGKPASAGSGAGGTAATSAAEGGAAGGGAAGSGSTTPSSELAAGKYDIAVVLWIATTPEGVLVPQPIGVAGSTASCADCQIKVFTITREAIQLDVSVPRILVTIADIWKRPTTRASSRWSRPAARAPAGSEVSPPSRAATPTARQGSSPQASVTRPPTGIPPSSGRAPRES